MTKSIPALIIVLFGSFSLHGQTISDSLLVEGHYRKFHFKKPQSNNENRNLVFILHGSGGDGLGMMKGTRKLEERAEAENILLVYPDGYRRYWNECRKEALTPPNEENINEQAFFKAMITYFSKNYSISTDRVFAIGTSGGGHMAYKLALTIPEKFRAVTAIIANLPAPANMDCEETKAPIPVMIINGTTDPVNPWNGGEIKAGNLILGSVRSTEETLTYWAALAGYSGEPVKTILPDADPADGKTIEQHTFAEEGKPEIVLLKVIGGKHDYPNDIDVYITAWGFFKRQI